ncbi:hypothetical protein B5E41_30430 [Rhizobium esperanzae]|uniref:MarR family transcriptional regulator n=1 Tax=Rhizobium esperanzae TaxID=1967781 RepID=A0A246DKN2_9HYPH|nr:hypothetical protein [Rhizobium esperanzae]OWO89533.1 hypothetical protein B5E41_30430 [Rhizobium esperanzae]
MAGNEEDVFRKAKSEYQALQILQVLMLREACGRSNDSILGVCLDKCGMYGTPEEIRAVISFLERSGLVRTDKVEEYVIVAITDSGERVAEGKQIVDGVARPTRK